MSRLGEQFLEQQKQIATQNGLIINLLVHQISLLTVLTKEVMKMALDTSKLATAESAEAQAVADLVTAVQGVPAQVAAAVAKALADAGVDDSAAQPIIDAATAQATSDTAALQSAAAALAALTPPAPDPTA